MSDSQQPEFVHKNSGQNLFKRLHKDINDNIHINQHRHQHRHLIDHQQQSSRSYQDSIQQQMQHIHEEDQNQEQQNSHRNLHQIHTLPQIQNISQIQNINQLQPVSQASHLENEISELKSWLFTMYPGLGREASHKVSELVLKGTPREIASYIASIRLTSLNIPAVVEKTSEETEISSLLSDPKVIKANLNKFIRTRLRNPENMNFNFDVDQLLEEAIDSLSYSLITGHRQNIERDRELLRQQAYMGNEIHKLLKYSITESLRCFRKEICGAPVGEGHASAPLEQYGSTVFKQYVRDSYSNENNDNSHSHDHLPKLNFLRYCAFLRYARDQALEKQLFGRQFWSDINTTYGLLRASPVEERDAILDRKLREDCIKYP